MASRKRKAKTSRKRKAKARQAISATHKGLVQAAEPPSDRNFANLDPAFQARLAAALSALTERGTPFKLVEGFRTVERQQWLFGSGRPTAVPFGRPGPIVTQRDGVKRLSNHQGDGTAGSGRGADCYPTRNGKVLIPPSSDPLWEKYASAAEQQSLVAGHHWPSFKDSPHVELPPARSAEQLREMIRGVPLPKAPKKKVQVATRGLKGQPTDALVLPAVPPSLADQSAQALVAGSGLSKDIMGWYDAYFSALQTLGWVMTSQTFREFSQSGKGLEVHKAILAVLTVALGPAAATLAVAKAVLDGLEQMGSNNGWLTLFDQQSVHSKVASFQIVTAVPQPNGMVGLGLVAFSLEASDKVTQVLFFKLKKGTAALKYAGGTAAIEETVLAALRKPLQDRLQVAATDFISSVPIPGH
jgi:hypothetical protein